LGAEPWGAAVAGVACATSGLVAGHVALGEMPHLHAMAWTPWCLSLALEGLRGRRRAFAWLAGVIALTILAGHVQYAYQALVGLAIFVLTACALDPDARRGWTSGLPRAALATALGVALAGITLLPALAYVSHSNRGGGLDWNTSTMGAIHPLELIRAFVPGFFGTANDSVYWGGFIREMSTPYVGLVPLVALPWAVTGRLRRSALLLAPMGLFGLLVAFSAYTPVHRWMYAVLPGFAFFRMPVRWLHLGVLALAVSGGLGLSSALGPRVWHAPDWRQALRAVMVPAALAIFLVALFVHRQPTWSKRFWQLEHGLRARVDSFLGPEPERRDPDWDYHRLIRVRDAENGTKLALGLASAAAVLLLLARDRSLASQVAAWALLVLASVDLWLSGHESVGTVPRARLETPAPIRELLASQPLGRTVTLVPGTAVSRPGFFDESYPGFNRFSQSYQHRAMAEGWRNVAGVFFVVPAGYRALAGVSSSFEHETVRDRPILDLLGVRWALVPRDDPPPEAEALGEWLDRGTFDDLRLLENPSPSPRVFIPERVEIAGDAAAARERLLAPQVARSTAVLVRDDLDPRATSTLALASRGVAGGRATLREERDERLVIDVDVARDALLVVADSFDTGWSAAIDGRDAPVLRADLALRAVPIPAGTHTVVLRYRPRSWIAGIAVTLVAFGIWITWLRRVREPRSSESR
ncbi:MAG: YfhO family protein, partial [bacterium]